MEEQRKSTDVLVYAIENQTKVFDELRQENKEAHQDINAHLKRLNGSVASNKEWINTNKTDIYDLIKDRKNFIKNLFSLVWKALVTTVAVVFGISWLR